jgi:acyl transferase domain-containing protein
VESIAIIGIGCRFPGGVNCPEDFWHLLQQGTDAITEIPADRFNVDILYDPRPAMPGKVVTRHGGFVEHVDQFDPSFFSISPREAVYMDPQQRLLLEVAWEAFESAGVTRNQLAGSRTGVFIGMWTNDYEARMYEATSEIDLYMTTGGGRYSASGRLSYAFDLRGPSLTIDTHCSSSLVAVHLACQSLRSGESELALAGGVNLILQSHITIAYSRSMMLAPDGRCKFGDAGANGYVRSEGIGVILLKPLSQAQVDQDPIYAVILGSAVNNDGNSSGLLVSPSREGQEALLQEAYRNAGISPGYVQYIEAHGTGTSVGDAVELRALGAVLARDRSPDCPCIVGSVKTNIGHTEAAAGIAGLIKVVLCLTHRTIPSSLHFQTPNPHVPWKMLPLMIVQEQKALLSTAQPVVAGVNSFGLTGTNAHVVLQEAPQRALANHVPLACTTAPHLLPLSAHSPEALTALVQSYHKFVTGAVNERDPALYDLCYTASVGRTHHDYRLALVVHDLQELAACLEACLQGEARPGVCSGRTALHVQRKIVFVFPGQGSQWFGMGQQLLEREPVFRNAIERCEDAMRQFCDWSLREILAAENTPARMDHIDVIQPTLFAMQVALAALWRSWGIEPDNVVGHSMGEVAAAHVAGALNLEDAARVICCRSRLLRRISGQGAMAVVELSLEQAQEALHGCADRVSVAVSNSARSTVLSGDSTILADLLQKLESQGVFCRWVKVDVASHSPQTGPLCPDLLTALAGLRPGSASISMYSTVTGQAIDGLQLNAQYWVDNLRQPVLFSSALQRLLEDGSNTFIEISAHPLLVPDIQHGIRQLGSTGIVVPSLRRDEAEHAVMLESLGALYTCGHSIDWQRLYVHGGQHVRLPAYPWQRERFWLEEASATPGSSRNGDLGCSSLGLLSPAVATSPASADLVQPPDDDTMPIPKLPSAEPPMREALRATAPGRQRRSLLESHLQAQLAEVLKLTPSRIDVHKAMGTLGLDSLMGLEFRSRLEASLGLTLPATVIWNYPTIAVLTSHLAETMGISLAGPATAQTKAVPEHTEIKLTGHEEINLLLHTITQLSEEEVERLLHEKMQGS